MKTATVLSVLLTVGSTAVAAPAKRAGEAVTITDISATKSSTSGTVQLSFTDPNYDDSTDFTLTWDRPGQPPADTWSADNKYLLSFPSGVDDIELLSFVIKRSGASETISVGLNSNGNDSGWTCGTIGGVPGTQRCYGATEFSVVPTSS